MSKTRSEKEQAVVEIADKLKKSKSVVFADYQGMTMVHLSNLRKGLRPQGADFTITKNTLLHLSLKEASLSGEKADLTQGSTATLFAYEDEVTPLKTLVKALKESGVGKIKGGFFGNTFLDADKVNRLATLPGKQELRGQVVGILVAPLRGLVSVMNGNLRNLVYALDQIRIQRGGE